MGGHRWLWAARLSCAGIPTARRPLESREWTRAQNKLQVLRRGAKGTALADDDVIAVVLSEA